MPFTHDSQEVQDRIYTEAYRAWVASLPPEKRAYLKNLNLAEPDIGRKTNKGDDELAMTLASCEEAVWGAGPGRQRNGGTACSNNQTNAREPASGAEAFDATRYGAGEVAVALASFCARVRSHPNPLLAFDTLCFATGLMGLEGRTQAALAELHGVTRSAFSKQVVTWLDIFELSPPRGCRSARMREKLRKAERPAKAPRKFSVLPEGRMRRPRKRNPDRSADPTVVFVRGLDLFRRWFKERCRKLPLRRWTPEAREILRVELTWFARLHAELEASRRSRSE